MTQGQKLKETILKLPKRECKFCGKLYPPTSACQKYCSIKCGEDYRLNHHSKSEEKFPKWICENCGHTIQLDFDPTKDIHKFMKIKCPRS